MATQCHSRFGFTFQGKIAAAFDGGEITSDAGLLLVREFDDRLGLTAALRDAVSDDRDRRYVTQDVLTLLRQRVYQIAAGDEDANDATYLRHDPTLQTVARRLGPPLASQPTLSRLENAVEWPTIRRLGRVLRQWFTRHAVARRQPPAELILDVDSTDDPTHGQQELSFFNGHYDEHMFHPLLVFAEGYLLGARLRPGDVGGATHLRPLLEPIVAHLRGALPATALALRADGAFCNPDLLDYADATGLTDAIGMPPNPKLDAAGALHRVHAQVVFERTGRPVPWFTSVRYQTRSWPRPRRVLAMIEHTAQGPNVRCVVTNRRGRAADLFAWYHQRGQAENFIRNSRATSPPTGCPAPPSARTPSASCCTSSGSASCPTRRSPRPRSARSACACSSSAPASSGRCGGGGFLSPPAGRGNPSSSPSTGACRRSARRPDRAAARRDAPRSPRSALAAAARCRPGAPSWPGACSRSMRRCSPCAPLSPLQGVLNRRPLALHE